MRALFFFLTLTFLLVTGVPVTAEELPASTEVLSSDNAAFQALLKNLDSKVHTERRTAYLKLLELGARVETALADEKSLEGRTLEAQRLIRCLKTLIAYRCPVSLEPGLTDLLTRFETTEEKKRVTMVNAITATGKKHAIPILKAILEKDKAYAVRYAAACELLKLGDLSGADYIFGADAVVVGLERQKVKDEYDKALEEYEKRDYLACIHLLEKVLEKLSKLNTQDKMRISARYNLACAHGLWTKELRKKAARLQAEAEAAEVDKDKLLERAKACEEKSREHQRKTLEALEAAINDGFIDYEHIEVDGDLDVVRDEKRFKELIEKLKQIHRDTVVPR